MYYKYIIEKLESDTLLVDTNKKKCCHDGVVD